MYQQVLESNYEIIKRLNLKDLYAVLLVNKKLSKCVNEPNFWRLKLEHDYNIYAKRSNQTWLERYTLSRHMGYICIPDILDDPPLPFDIGKLVDIGNKHIYHYANMLNIRAISALLVRQGLYYLTDELEFYMSGMRTYYDDVYQNKLIDDNVTYIAASLDLILYIKHNDLYVYTSEHKKIRLTYAHNIVQVSANRTDIVYVSNDGICYKIDKFDENICNMHKYVKSNISKVITSIDGLLLLTKDNKIEVYGCFDIVADIPTSEIIDIFGFIMFLTSNHRIISCEHISELDVDSNGITQFTLCSNFENISNVISAAEGTHGKFCLTKTGDVYCSYGDLDNCKLSVKAKNIVESPDGVILII